MRLDFELTERALADLADLWTFHARADPGLADRRVNALLADLEELTLFPEMGRVSEVAPGLRVLVSGKHLVFYRPTDGGVLVHRVLHGHRDIEALFEPEG